MSQFTGPVHRSGDDGYDDEQAGFQRGVQNKPALVVGAADADDVRTAVRLAADEGRPVGVQATGHGTAATEDGAVLITTGRLTEVRVDPERGTARVGAGVQAGQLIAEAARYGLAPVNGSSPDVGVVSYTLAGGLGILGRGFGYAADGVRAVELVDAAGEVRRVTADGDARLFWALRGAGANFGVVTALEVDLHPLAEIYAGGMYFDADLVPEVLARFLDWTSDVPEQMAASVAALKYPDMPMLPEPLRGRYAVHVRIVHTGDAAEGERLIAPLRAIGPRLIDQVGPMPYADCGSIYRDPPMPHAYQGASVLPSTLDTDALLAAARAAADNSVLEVRHLGGALSRPAEVPNAVGHRSARYLLRCVSGPIDDAVHEDIYRTALAGQPVARRLNFLYGQASTTDKVADCFEPADLARLRALKAEYDPANTFGINYNIAPA